MVLASVFSSIKTGITSFCFLPWRVWGALSEIVPGRESTGIEEIRAFFVAMAWIWPRGWWDLALWIFQTVKITYILAFRNMPRWGGWGITWKGTWALWALYPGKLGDDQNTSPWQQPPTHPLSLRPLCLRQRLLGWAMGLTPFPFICILQKSNSFHSPPSLGWDAFSFPENSQCRYITSLTTHALTQQIGMII